MEIKRSVKTFEKIDDGIVIVDYPTEILAKKITEQGRENIEKINKFFSEFHKKKTILKLF